MRTHELDPAPYRIETARLVLRCYAPADAPLVKEAVDASVDHLRPWMTWARSEPQPVEAKAEWLQSMRAEFESGESYVYGVFDPDETRLLGGSGLHRRGGPGSLEIGYWVRSDAVRQGIATEVTAVLTRAAFEHCGAVRVDVQIDPENVRSTGVPRKLGFRHEGTYRGRLEPREDGGPRRDSMVFSVLREEFTESPCRAYDYAAFDAHGNALAA
jgi:RimJ/RimL family protein N-acetyltransferase